jgi:HEAT repeat protein
MDIARIQKDIAGASEDARFMAFLTLYESNDPDAKSEIVRIMTVSDPVQKLMLLRFLGHVTDARAIDYICQMLEDENHVVVDAAERAFDRNQYDKRLKILTPLIASSHRRAQLVAIDHVAHFGWAEALPLLISQLDNPDEELALALLSALRFLPSRSALMPIMKFMNHPNEQIRFRAVMALGVIYELFDLRLRGTLVQCLEDKSPQVRQAAVWSLRRKPQRRIVPMLMRMSAQDVDPMVRQEALLGLQSFPTISVIHHLLALHMSESNRMVALRCESVVLGMEHGPLLKSLSRIISRETGPVRDKAILLAAEFRRDSDEYYQSMVNELQNARADRDRVVYLEALGALGNPKASQVLLPYLRQSMVVAYVAMASLLKLNDESLPFLDYLEDPQGSLLLKQMILRYLIRREQLVATHRGRLERCLLGFLESDNINMRYLAAQVLVGISGRAAQDAMLKTMRIETDPTSLRLLRNSLIDFFTKDPAGYVSFLHDKRHDADTFDTLCSIMGQLIWNGVDIVAQLPRLFSYELLETGDVYIGCCSGWLSDQVIAGRVRLDDVIRALEHTIVIDVVLQKIVVQVGKVSGLRLDVSPTLLWRRLEEGNDIERGAVIELMGMSYHRDSVPVLVSVVCSSQMSKFHTQAARALARITQETT